MGEGGDEGIDHCYVFCNGTLVNSDEHPITRDSTLKVKFFQTKKENSFSTDGFRKTVEGIKEIFNLDLDLTKLQGIGANKDILDKADLIRKVLRTAKKNRANFSCELYFVTAASEKKISPKIDLLSEQLKENLRSLDIEIDIDFWGAQELLNMTKSLNESIEIQFNSQPMEIKDRDIPTSGFSGFVTGNSIIRSLLTESGDFKSHLTEGNIRYFLGEDGKINNTIIETIKDTNKTDIFWAMNNGLTIIADDISPLGNNQYDIENPQIVNGCQTIHCLYLAFKELGELPANLKVFLKLVKTDNLDIQTDIISATNSQNPVKAASLKANDDIQRNIETHLKKSEIYYERRENFYKRQGHTGNKVIGLLKMAQIVHSVVNKEAVVAANDTTTLFDSDVKYKTLFNDSADFDIYTFSVGLFQKIWSIKNSDLRTNDYEGEEKDLISKGGYIFLHCMSSLIITEAFNSNNDGSFEIMTGKMKIDEPQRKNKFSKCKKKAFQLINDDDYLKKKYDESKQILEKAVHKFAEDNPSKLKVSVFKNRSFDKDYLVQQINEHYKETCA